MTDLLREYLAIVNGLSIEDRYSFNDFFIGILSWHAPASKWRKSLESAQELLKETKEMPHSKRLTTLSPSTGPSERAASGEDQ